MSRMHFPHKNLAWDKMLNLLCYNTEKPLLLSKKQRVTRLYKSFVRTLHDETMRGTATEGRTQFRRSVRRGRADFEDLLTRGVESPEFAQLISKYEKFIDEHYDPSMLMSDNSAHSPNSQKLMIYSDEVR